MKINVDKEDAMLETVERIIKRCLGGNADGIRKSEKITNNFVYSFAVADDHYFLKLYRSKEWPEAGKIPFVYQSLARKNIPCAELIAYERDDETYPDVMIMDEPLASLDENAAKLVCEIINELAEDKLIVLISHGRYYDISASSIVEVKNGTAIQR